MTTPWFASFGAEKMIYDARMNPQAIIHDGTLYVAYQAGKYGKAGDPYIITMDLETKKWSEAVKVGTVSGVDHHFAPIIWFDKDARLHCLYGCHRTTGQHIIAEQPGKIDAWFRGPKIDDSMTYPTMWRTREGELILIYRIHGHLGFWVSRYSEDGGFTWSNPRIITDFDAFAMEETDRWAGSYLSTFFDGETVHVGFTHWEERDNINKFYNNFKRDLYSRYNLYYLALTWKSGDMCTIDKKRLVSPITRKSATPAMVYDSGYELTNFPAMSVDENGYPMLVCPITHDSPWRCNFTSFHWNGKEWEKSIICETDNIWNATLLQYNGNSEYQIWLVNGRGKDETCFYGGGELQLWKIFNNGKKWEFCQSLIPDSGLIYNNPKQVYYSDGRQVKNNFVFFGWEGPESMWKRETENPNRGFAFFYEDGIIRGSI